MSGVRPPEGLSDRQRQFWKELVNRVSTSLAEGAARQPPASLSAEQRSYWKELVNRVHAVSVHGARGPLSKVPGVPANPSRITRDMLEDIAEWKMNSLSRRAASAAKIPFGADWNPSLHPRGPDGKFVERPWDMAIGLEDINSTSTHKLVEFLGDTAGEPDMDAVLSNDGIRIDGIPDDVDSVDELKERVESPQSDMDVPSNPNDFGELDEGDIIRTPEGPREVLSKGSDGSTLEVRTPDGARSTFDMSTQSRNTVDVYDVDAMDDLPSQGGTSGDGDDLTLDDLTLDDFSPENDDFVEERHDADVGDFVRINPRIRDERDEDFIAEVTDKRYEGAEYTVVTEDGEELEVGAGESLHVEGYIPADSGEGGDGDGLDLPDPSDPDGGRWKTEGVISPDEGDEVRFNSPRTMELEVGRVTDDGGMGPMTVETADGETFNVGEQADPDNGVYEFKGVFEPDAESLDFNDLTGVDDRDTTDLTELDGTPAERREAVMGDFAGEIPEDAVTNEEIPEGVVIAKDRNTNNPFKYEVLGYEEDQLGDTELKIRSEAGRERTISARIANERYQFWDMGDEPDVTIPESDWGDDDTPLAQRSRALKSIMDDVVPAADEAPDGNSDGNLDPESFEETKEVVAKALARSKSKDHAEKVMSRLTSIGQRGRAHAVIDKNVFGTTTAYFSVDNDEDHDVIVHELGHAVGDIYDLKGGSNDMDGKTHPMPDFAWNSPNYDVPQKYGMKTPPDSDKWDDTKAWDAQPSFNLDDWKDEVDAQVGTGLDGRNFSGVESPEDVPLQEGAMIQLSESPSYGDPKQWRISEVLDEQGGSSLDAVGRVRLENRDGEEYEADLTESFGEARVDWGDDAPYVSGTGDTISGKRNSTPDNWREDPPDPDDWLGTESYDDPDEAMRNLGDKVNKAWYRQAAATREHGTRDASKYSILGGYSAKQAHETMSRIHHVMTPGGADTGRKVSDEKRAEAAMALVKYHPDLLEAYRNVYETPVIMEQALNAVLEQEGADFRFDTVEPQSIGGMETIADAVEDVYAGGEA